MSSANFCPPPETQNIRTADRRADIGYGHIRLCKEAADVFRFGSPGKACVGRYLDAVDKRPAPGIAAPYGVGVNAQLNGIGALFKRKALGHGLIIEFCNVDVAVGNIHTGIFKFFAVHDAERLAVQRYVAYLGSEVQNELGFRGAPPFPLYGQHCPIYHGIIQFFFFSLLNGVLCTSGKIMNQMQTARPSASTTLSITHSAENSAE